MKTERGGTCCQMGDHAVRGVLPQERLVHEGREVPHGLHDFLKGLDHGRFVYGQVLKRRPHLPSRRRKLLEALVYVRVVLEPLPSLMVRCKDALDSVDETAGGLGDTEQVEQVGRGGLERPQVLRRVGGPADVDRTILALLDETDVASIHVSTTFGVD